MKILMVDDDTELLSIFEIALKKEGYEIITAYDGKTGIEKAKAEKPSLILLDQVLPDITGNDIVKLLKEEPETKNIPVAMLSNFGQSELIQEAINQGAVDYILKYQIETQDLVNKVKNACK
jgi:two-component system alkaline phosphatase synthesis response regulator PhoP